MGEAIGALAAKRRVSLKEMAGHVLRAESPEAEREEGEDTGALRAAAAGHGDDDVPSLAQRAEYAALNSSHRTLSNFPFPQHPIACISQKLANLSPCFGRSQDIMG